MSKRQQIATLILIVALGFALRLRGLSRVGFNEDEVHKVEAARSYLCGNFSFNLEHPMLMKSLIAISLTAADFWNGRLGHSHQVPEEVSVRLPNVLFGSLTAVVIFLLAQEFFGVEVGLLSALLWSIGTIAIMVNREAKEDTLLVFFSWLAYYFYIRAKKVSLTDTRRAEWYYGASGGCFGLMLASKYFPHYLGLIFLFYALLGDKAKFPPRRWRDTMLLLGTCALVFILADPVFLLPNTLTYMLHYVREGTMTHHGYLVMGRFYFDYLADSPGNAPLLLPVISHPQDPDSSPRRPACRSDRRMLPMRLDDPDAALHALGRIGKVGGRLLFGEWISSTSSSSGGASLERSPEFMG